MEVLFEMSLVPFKEDPERKKKVIEELLRGSSRSAEVQGEGMIVKTKDGYLFTNIAYQGRILPAVELSGGLLDSGKQRTQEQWVQYSVDGWCATDAEVLYQCLLRAYDLRNDSKCRAVVQDLNKVFQQVFDPAKPYINTLTKISYGTGLDGIVSRLGRFPGNAQNKSIIIPEFTKANDSWSYFVLANEQSESKLGATNVLHANARPVLEAMLGKGYEKAGSVFQYFSTRKDSNLRETRLWTPTTTNRNSERVLVLGVVSSDDGFGVDSDGVIGDYGPALGVRRAKNISTRNEGAQ